MVLICIFLMREVEPLFKCLLAICMSSFADLKMNSFVFSLLNYEFFILDVGPLLDAFSHPWVVAPSSLGCLYSCANLP